MTDYIVISPAKITNNNGAYIETWPVGKKFTTGQYIKDGKLYLGTNGENVNRWIPVGTYSVFVPPVDPPPVDPPTSGDVINIRKSRDGGLTWYESKYYDEITDPATLALIGG